MGITSDYNYKEFRFEIGRAVLIISKLYWSLGHEPAINTTFRGDIDTWDWRLIEPCLVVDKPEPDVFIMGWVLQKVLGNKWRVSTFDTCFHIEYDPK